ncbi:MAG TPA: gliding motility-associated C-terminal domain-containing protein [Bacteroidia bacterium]|nr:gliding motility-associated C-terminal domain-containing protein [Bacteroidia bacterium]
MIKPSILTFLFLSVLFNTGKAQVFWKEGFQNGCNSGCLATTYGGWKITTGTSEGASANNWFVSCAVEGLPSSSCETGCVKGNNSLHVSSASDANSSFTKGAAGQTDKRVESPTINCTGKRNIQIEFNFICRADTLANVDHCDLMYSADDGANWSVLAANLTSDKKACNPTAAMWQGYIYKLPASADDNSKVRIGFHWQNKADVSMNTAFAVDSIRLSSSSVQLITGSVPTQLCACSTFPVTYDGTGGGFLSGNQFTLQLSDATGNFTNATTIGVRSSTADTGRITAIIPCNIPPGTAYRIRVLSSNPVYQGIDNGVNITITAPIVITATPNPDTICAGTSPVIKGLGGDPGSYVWYTMAMTQITTLDSLVVTPPPTVNTNYIVFGKKGACVDSTIVKVVIQPRPVVNVTNDTTCKGLGAVVKASGGTKYLWSNGTTKDSLVVFPTKDTIVTVLITNGHCVIKDTAKIKVFDQITVSITSPTPAICSGEVATLTATGALNYTWNNGQTGSVIKVSPTATTSYTVTGTAGACKDLAVFDLKVNQKPDVQVATPAPVCEGQSVFLKATGAQQYFWLVPTPNSNHDTITVRTPFSKEYAVVGISNGCQDTAYVLVTVDQRPNVDVNSATICLGGSVVLKATGAHHYVWELNGATTDSITVSPTQYSIYRVFGFSENGTCKDTGIAVVIVGKPIPVTISGVNQIYSCESTLLSAEPTDGTYMWGVIGDSDGKIDCETCVSTLVTPQNTLAYYVKYTTPAGCIGMDTILVNVIDISAYFLATGFSPNGDGINDVVQVHGRGIDHLSFMIFDRVGEKVFETHELETGWDGRYMGVPMNSGVFVYRLEIYYCSGQNIKETGNITLLR